MPWALLRAEVAARKSVIRFAGWRQRRQMWVDKLARQGWGRWTDVSRRATVFATVRGMLPEVLDLHQAYAPALTALEPDILHVHHPFLLPTAAAVREVLSSRGRQVSLLYDARENFAGIPPEEQGNRRRHHVVVSLEARTIRTADMVTTVSPLIAQELRERYGLRELPTTVLNMPVLRDEQGAPGTTVRDLAGVGPATALLVYSGTMSRARGMEVLIDALAYVPNAVLALVTVPYPHPMTAGLMDRATRLEVADRIRASTVGQDELVPFLSGADVGVHPLPSGSPNHDMAMPNKLYEYLHAGLTLVVSDARAVAEFVHVHGVGEVFRSGDAVDMARAIRAALEGRDGHDPRAEGSGPIRVLAVPGIDDRDGLSAHGYRAAAYAAYCVPGTRCCGRRLSSPCRARNLTVTECRRSPGSVGATVENALIQRGRRVLSRLRRHGARRAQNAHILSVGKARALQTDDVWHRFKLHQADGNLIGLLAGLSDIYNRVIRIEAQARSLTRQRPEASDRSPTSRRAKVRRPLA